jgi:hypothetical protein
MPASSNCSSDQTVINQLEPAPTTVYAFFDLTEAVGDLQQDLQDGKKEIRNGRPGGGGTRQEAFRGALLRCTEYFSPEPGKEAVEDFKSREGRTGGAEMGENVVECHFEKKWSLNVRVGSVNEFCVSGEKKRREETEGTDWGPMF